MKRQKQPLLRTTEVAALIGLTRQQIWRLAGGIPGATKVGKQWRFDVSDPGFKEWVKQRKALLVGRSRAPTWYTLLLDLSSRIRHADPSDLDHLVFVISLARVVKQAYTRLVEINWDRSQRLLLDIKLHVEYVAWLEKQGRLSRALGKGKGSHAKMNGKWIGDFRGFPSC